jgi:hypothetical protein
MEAINASKHQYIYTRLYSATSEKTVSSRARPPCEPENSHTDRLPLNISLISEEELFISCCEIQTILLPEHRPTSGKSLLVMTKV